MSNETPVFIGGRERQVSVVLDFPLSFQGRDYGVVTVRRLSAAEVADFMEAVRVKVEAGGSDRTRFPMFYDVAGQRVPDAVLDAMDDDDRAKIDEIAGRFLPRRFQAALQEEAGEPSPNISTPPSGEATAPTSAS